MKRILLPATLFLSLLLLSGQQRDSLSTVRLLHESRAAFETADYDQALEKAQIALGQMDEKSAALGDCLLLLADIFLEKGEYDAAQQHYSLALETFQKRENNQHKRHWHSMASENACRKKTIANKPIPIIDWPCASACNCSGKCTRQ